MSFPCTPAERVFWQITRFRWLVFAFGLALIGATGTFIPQLTSDTTADSFIDPDNEALIYRETVEEVFGLADPIVIAVIDKDEDGIFDAEALSLVERISDGVRRIAYVDPDKVTSLATENNIVGVEDGMIVEGFFDDDAEFFQAAPGTERRADEVRRAIEDFPLYRGSLVARDGVATIVIAELLDENDSTAAYDAILDLIDDVGVPEGIDVHVAGEGAVSGYLQTYIDEDARRLNPIAAVIITIVLVIAFMSMRSALLPNIIILGTVAGSIGTMAAVGVDFYVITNGLIVNLIGIAVADSVHILSEYYTQLRKTPDAPKRQIVARAMAKMWRPVTLTTVTTMAGFLALAASSVMPPVRYFGLFGALGVFVAWIYSMSLLPAMLSLWPSSRLPLPFRRRDDGAAADNVSVKVMRGFGVLVLANPRAVVLTSAALVLFGAVGASLIRADDARIENFKSTEPLYLADKAINSVMDGTYYLDVLVETAEPEGLYDPEHLRRMETLQEYLVSLPNVNGATSIVDYVKQLHRAVNEGDPDSYVIPDDPLLIAQLFFLYNASADPTDFEEEVETGFQRALIRANVDVGDYSNNKILVPALQRYLAEEFNTETITGTETGRVTVDYYWINGIDRSNLYSVVLSFGAVLITAMIVFRSVLGGLIAASPVGVAVLVVYAVMGFAGIELGVGTSMFSAIAIGLSVDFAIHGLDRIRELVRAHGFGDDALIQLFPTTGRALLFNFIAVAGGFGVLSTSDVPPLVLFGSLVAVAVSVAFLASMTLVPALVKLLKPSFLTRPPKGVPHAEVLATK